MIKLDIKDKKILDELDRDARQTNSAISKKVRLSVKGVEYRISQLVKKGVIQGYYPVIDFLKLGYRYDRVFMRLQHLNDPLRNQMEEYIKKSDTIDWAIWFYGSYDLGMALWTKSAREFKDRLSDFVTRFSDHIGDLHHSQVIGLEHFPYAFSKDSTKDALAIMKETQSLEAIDETDRTTLLQLNENARLSSTQIGRNIHSNYKLVSYRLKNLQNQGVFITSRARINHIALGLIHYKVCAYISFSEKKSIGRFNRYLASLSHTLYLIEHTETHFIDFELVCSSVEEFQAILRRISNHFPNFIKEFQYFTFGKTIKISFLPTK